MAFAHTEYERKAIGMDDYIKREALRDALYDADAITINGVKILNQFPSSDVEPVKHGRWVQVIVHVEFEDGFVDRVEECCSVCHEPNERRCTYFCPNCGARMDGE